MPPSNFALSKAALEDKSRNLSDGFGLHLPGAFARVGGNDFYDGATTAMRIECVNVRMSWRSFVHC
jgi:hypothetical protein